MKHYSVLLKESIDGLNIKPNGIYVDATLGYGGHSAEILNRLDTGFLYAFDADLAAISYANKRLTSISSNYKIIHSNFVHVKEELVKNHVEEIDGILFDLGVSSPQIDEVSRGFSFMQEARLDMRMNRSQKFSAFDVVNTYSYEDLAHIFFTYGEEEKSKLIAKKIIAEREHKQVETTTELVEIIKSSVGANYFNKKHPERKIFQAIRIEVNDELHVLESVLPDAIKMLKKGGRIVVITFHSLEDRIVKKAFKKYSEVDALVKGLPDIPEEYKPTLQLVNKKVITASVSEIKNNSRSKSAKLRIGGKL